MNGEALREHLHEHPVIAILRSDTGEHLDACIDALVDAGVRTLEVTVPTPGAVTAVDRAVRVHGATVAVGMGTVTTCVHVDDAAAVGAGFIVSPHTDPELIMRADAAGLASLPGAGTVTEVIRAWRAGAGAVKLFPVCTLGPSGLADLRAPIPGVPLIAVGGVDATLAQSYLEAGALGVGVGSPLLGRALADGDVVSLAERADAFITSVTTR